MKLAHIIVATDLSESMEPAYEWLRLFSEISIAKPRITLIHFPQIPEPAGNFIHAGNYAEGFLNEYFNRAQLALENVVKREDFKGMDVKGELIILGDNDFGAGIAGFSQKNPADLVILVAKHRNTGLLTGSRLSQMLKAIKSPVFICGKKPIAFHGRIAFATDFSRPSTLVYRQLTEMFAHTKTTISPFFVNTPAELISQNAFREKSLEFSKSAGLKGTGMIKLTNAWSVEEGICNFSEDTLADIIAVSWQDGKSNVPGVFRNSLTEFLLRESALPIIVLPAPREK